MMCTRRFVVTRTMLGNREQGWALWNGKEIVEMTSKEIKDAIIRKEEIFGLAIGAGEELELDKAFFTRNIMEHRQVGNYKPMIEEDDCVANVFYIVIGKAEKDGYEVISTKFERTVISEEKAKVMLTMGIISAGAKLENDEVVLPVTEVKPAKAEKKTEEKKPTTEKPVVKAAVGEKKQETGKPEPKAAVTKK